MNIKSMGFISAGLANVGGVLLFSKLFSNEGLNNAFPSVFSNFGLFMILVWGAAYISVNKTYNKVPALIAVFAIEKLVYVATWIYWHVNHDVMAMFETDAFTASFMIIYGLNDAAFMLFFAWVVFTNSNSKQN